MTWRKGDAVKVTAEFTGVVCSVHGEVLTFDTTEGRHVILCLDHWDVVTVEAAK